jgi:peroxiredoxin
MVLRKFTRGSKTMPLDSAGIEVGDRAPEFCLPHGLSGDEVCLQDYLGKKIYLMFLRGSW